MTNERNAKKILIVEDGKELLLSLSILLKSQGYLTIGAPDALFGISLAHKERPDLIILDLGLPAGGGFYVLESINDSIETNDIPVMILTGQQGIELEEKARKMGVAAYLHKPFEPKELLSRVKEILDR
ncbi:MAG: response regulator [Candidatus Omnitrophota bacterium]|nr:response regulator [Candidatus Omnitrophota bacterium]